MKYRTSSVCLVSLLAAGCAGRVANVHHCHAFVEAKSDLAGDFYSLTTGEGPGYLFTFRLQGADPVRLGRLRLIVVGMSEAAKFGEVGDSVSFDLSSAVPMDGVLHEQDVLRYSIQRNGGSSFP